MQRPAKPSEGQCYWKAHCKAIISVEKRLESSFLLQV